MDKIVNDITLSVQVQPTIGGSVSSSALIDTSLYRRAVISAALHKLPDAKGEGVATLTVYESTAAT